MTTADSPAKPAPHAAAGGPAEPQIGTVADKGLRGGALGFVSSVAIAIASTGPALVFATVFGVLVYYMGFHAPGMMMLAIVPVLLIAITFRELNAVEPDCGTTFVWVGKALGPRTGFMAGWAQFAATLVILPASANVVAVYAFMLIGADGLAHNPVATTLLGLAFVVIVTTICYVGVEVVAWVQKTLVFVELALVVTLIVTMVYKISTGSFGAGGSLPQLDWFNPFGVPAAALASGFTVAVFAFWGWELTFTLSEETKGSKTPARASFVSIVTVAILFVIGITAVIAYAGPDFVTAHGENLLDVVAEEVLGSWVGKLLVFSVFSSILAATQATILPSSRQLFAMSVYGAVPKYFARINRFQSPGTATVAIGVIACVLCVFLSIVSTNVLVDSLSATGMLIAFYYAMTALACFWRFRDTITHSVRNFIVRCVVPITAITLMIVAFVLTAINYLDAESGASSLFGIGGIFVLSVGMLAVGAVLMVVLSFTQRSFFSGKTLSEKHDLSDVNA